VSGGILQTAIRNTNVRLELQYQESFIFTGSEEPETNAGLGLPDSDPAISAEFDYLLKAI
jgi:hypothetical protein